MSSTGSSRGNPAMGDILRSVAVLGVIVLAIWGIGRFFTSTPEQVVRPVDYAGIADSARPAADFDLLAPRSLPAGWKATSARYSPGSWHLGVLTGEDEYVGLEQTRASVARTVDEFVSGSTSAGTVSIRGEDWLVRVGPDGDVTFVRRDGGLTTLVTSDAPRAVVRDYVASLSSS